MATNHGRTLPTEERERVRQALLKLLERYGTQPELAKALGVTQPTVSNLLSGRNTRLDGFWRSRSDSPSR